MYFLKKQVKIFFLFFIILAITLLIYTFLLYNQIISTDEDTIRTTTYIIGSCLFFILGLISSIIFKSKGLLRGFISSLIVIILMIVIKLLFGNINILYFVKIATYIITSMLGGIFGVNIANRKNK